jgi:hypothetical protein
MPVNAKLAAIASLALLACSSSSDPSSPPAQDAATVQDAGVEAAPSGDGYVSAQMGDAAACAQSTGAACQSCCELVFPGAEAPYVLAQQDCICGGSGSCAGTCSDSDCLALSSVVPACEACLQQAMPGCATKGASACQASAFCTAYTSCLSSCN